MTKEINEKEVELYLLDNLDFFEKKEALVSELKFKHSSSSASSLLERQIKKLREEQKDLISLLESFVKTANLNEDLFNKSKKLTLSILEANSKEEIMQKVEESFIKDFNVDECFMNFYSKNDLEQIEEITSMSVHKGAIYCGSYSKEKMKFLFKTSKIQSMVLAVVAAKEGIGLLKLGSYDRQRYLGDEDTTFIKYVRDILEKRFDSF